MIFAGMTSLHSWGKTSLGSDVLSFFFFNCLVISANIVSREFEGCWSVISSCSSFVRLLHHGHVGLTSHHSSFLIVLLLFRGVPEEQGAEAPPCPRLQISGHNRAELPAVLDLP